MNDWTYNALSVTCVDGDTIDAQCDLGFGMRFECRFRLAGVNTPERGRDGFHEATKHLQMLLENKAPIRIRTVKDKREKFGRYLARLIGGDGSDINQMLIDSGHAVPYM